MTKFKDLGGHFFCWRNLGGPLKILRKKVNNNLFTFVRFCRHMPAHTNTNISKINK